MGRFLAVTLFLIVSATASAQTLTIEKLTSFLTSSVKLNWKDKDVADYLAKVKLTTQLPAGFLLEMKAAGMGPRTEEALQALAGRSKSLPPAPQASAKEVDAPPSRPAPSAEERKRILDWMREYAANYSKNLPDFICVQVTRRYVDPSGLELWQKQDTVTAKLSYFEDKENYDVILVNNHPVQNMAIQQLGGASSTGEFGTMLKEIFEKESHTEFHWLRYGTLRGRLMHVFSYKLPRRYSKWTIKYDDLDPVIAGQEGLVYVDHDTELIMRIAQNTTDIPAGYPLFKAWTTLDYDFTKIGESEFVLPLRAEIRMRAAKLLTKNEVEFRLYRKYSAEATITFDAEPDALDKSQTEEQPAPPPAPPTAPSPQAPSPQAPSPQ